MTTAAGFPERFYDHNRKRIPWIAPLFFLLATFGVFQLVQARTTHTIYGRVSHGRGPIELEADPSNFWVTVVIYVAALAICLGILGLLGLGALAARRRART